MKKTLALLIIILFFSGISLFVCRNAGVPDRDIPSVQMEYLDRGTIAVMTDKGVYLSWRLLGTEAFDTSFIVFRNEKRIAEITDSTNYIDKEGTINDRYTILPLSETNGADEQAYDVKTYGKPASVYPDNQIVIPLQVPESKLSEENEIYSYSSNDATCADLDGDGEYEIILKWEPSNSFDSGLPAKHTGSVYIDAYKMNGKMLWRIDLGKNISAGAHFTQMIAYDFDLDGNAELILKTAPGSMDGTGRYVSEASEIASVQETDNLADYRGKANAYDATGGRVLSGDEYLTVFEGRTGKAVDTIYYPFPRGTIDEWGDSRGNRSERYLAAVAYLDGINPHFISWRGYYAKTTVAAYRLIDKKLVLEHSFDSSVPGYELYEGQGNHNLAVADVDNDGKDEILCGSLALDHDLSVLWCSQRGHGDALHLADYDSAHDGLEYFCIHETPPYGMTVYDAATGEELIHIDAERDTGRGMMAHTGYTNGCYEIWAAYGNQAASSEDSVGFYISYGGKVFRESEKKPPSQNFRIFWDSDIFDELLDGSGEEQSPVRILKQDAVLEEFPNTRTTNGTKQNVSLMADILGDWREEIVVPSPDGQSLILLTSTIMTGERLFTLMHDRAYRMQVACQNVGYNQPPHIGYYLGAEDDEKDTRKEACFIRTVYNNNEYYRRN